MRGRSRFYGLAPPRVLTITAIVAAVIMGDSMMYAVLPTNVSAFAVSAGLVGVLLSANRFVRLVSNPLADRLFRRFGAERPLALAVVLSIGTTLAYGIGPGFAVLLIARLLWGLCYSILRLGGYVTVLEDGREGDRARLMGLSSGGQRAGSIVGVLLGGILFDLTGRLASFSIVAGLGLVALPLVFGIVKRPSPTRSDKAAISISIPMRADAREEDGSFLQGMLAGQKLERTGRKDGPTVSAFP